MNIYFDLYIKLHYFYSASSSSTAVGGVFLNNSDEKLMTFFIVNMSVFRIFLYDV